MTKAIRIVSLLAICFGLSGAYAADPTHVWIPMNGPADGGLLARLL